MNVRPQPVQPASLAEGIGAIWLRSKMIFLERVTVIEHALALLIEDSLDPGARSEAERAAHTLAGSLGTFGVGHGSTLARALEQRIADVKGLREEDVLRLSELAMALRAEVERGP
ncbi:MAG: Hpt domain-containing protein [Gammaproteobacteria bacterium]